MNVTLLGTGDATSVPAPLCDCEYCLESERRRHPSLLVETDASRLLFDVGPDIQEQLWENVEWSDHLDRWLAPVEISDDETVTVGECSVTAVPVEHHRPRNQTLGFLVEADNSAVCYVPDMRQFLNGPPDGDVDLLVCEGAAVLGQPVHGPKDELLAAIESVEADHVVLVNVNEHLQRKHTDELQAIAAEQRFELGTDFMHLELN